MDKFGDRFGKRTTFLLIVAWMVAVTVQISMGFICVPSARAQSQAAAAPTPAFDVASIKPTDPNRPGPIGTATYPGGKLIITQYTLKMLIHEAYGVQDDQISGGARWMGEDRYDLEAVPPASSDASKFNPPTRKTPPTAEMLLMLRALLADRFQLKIHTESKIGKGYALVVAAHGAKLTGTKNPDAFRVVGYGHTGNPERPEYMQGENASMSMLAAKLATNLRCPVLDQTGIKGDFDFKFEYAEDDTQEDSGPSIFSAIQEQLGLKLVPAKAPVEIIVIDHAEKPSAN